LVRISVALGTTPNWLLGATDARGQDPRIAELLERLLNAAANMTIQELEIYVIQAEAIVAARP
jgi:hypothetical protein